MATPPVFTFGQALLVFLKLLPTVFLFPLILALVELYKKSAIFRYILKKIEKFICYIAPTIGKFVAVILFGLTLAYSIDFLEENKATLKKIGYSISNIYGFITGLPVNLYLIVLGIILLAIYNKDK